MNLERTLKRISATCIRYFTSNFLGLVCATHMGLLLLIWLNLKRNVISNYIYSKLERWDGYVISPQIWQGLWLFIRGLKVINISKKGIWDPFEWYIKRWLLLQQLSTYWEIRFESSQIAVELDRRPGYTAAKAPAKFQQISTPCLAASNITGSMLYRSVVTRDSLNVYIRMLVLYNVLWSALYFDLIYFFV